MKMLLKWQKSLLAFGMGLGLLLFFRQLWLGYIGVRQLGWQIFSQASYLLPAMICALLLYLAQMAAWTLTLRCLGINLGLKETFAGFQLSLLPRYIPGSVWGYLGRSQWLKQYHGVSYATSLTASLIEATLQALTALATGVFCYGMTVDGSDRFIPVLVAIAVLMLAWLAIPPVTATISWRRGYVVAAFSITSGIWLAAVVTHVLLWLAYGASLFCIMRAVVLWPLAAWGETLAASSLSWLVGFIIPIVPAGIGIREMVLAALLTRTGSLSDPQANLISVILRFGLIVAELLWLSGGLAIFARRWHRNRVIDADSPVSGPR